MPQSLFVSRIAAAVIWGLAAASESVDAQSVRLQIASIANRSGAKNSWGRDAEPTTERSFNRTETLKVTVTNMQTEPGEYLVKWHFLAKDVATKEVHIYDTGTKLVSLKGGAFTSFEVQSKPLPENQTTYYYYDDEDNELVTTGQRSQSGAKPAGYVFLVKADGKLIALEASDRDLKDKFQKKVDANKLRPAP